MSSVDPKASEAAAMKIVAALKQQFHVDIDVTMKDGYAVVTLNNGHVASGTDSNPNVLTAKSLSAAIDGPFNEFRRKGWTFTQPQGGKFTIGVPEMNESVLLKAVIQDLINDRIEQAQVSIHDYIVAKTQQIAGLNESTK